MMHNFLADYQNVLLRHVIIPGSHDAGLAADSYGSLGLGAPKSKTVTQSAGVGRQAICGSRFFDVRIIKSGGQLKSYHSPGDTRKVGGVGQGFESILNELRDFVARNQTEFVIIRLSHLQDTSEVFTLLRQWMEQAPSNGIGVNGDLVYKGKGNLATKFVHELAGRIIFLVEGKKMAIENFYSKAEIKGSPKPMWIPGQADGFHTLYQNKEGKALPDVTDGLCICGEFSSSTKLDKIVSKQSANYTAHDKHRTHGDNKAHLYCLYWTSTGGNIQQNTQQLSTNFQEVRSMVANMQGKTAQSCIDNNIPLVNTKAWSTAISLEDQARRKYAVLSCSLPNIILYDFVNEDTSKAIVGLNGLTLCKT